MKRVFIYSTRTLFGSGIYKLIDAEPTLTIVGWETDIEKALTQIQELQPDTILAISEVGPIAAGQRFLRIGGKAKVVELSMEDNTAHIYASEQIAIQEVNDLVKAIENPDIISVLSE